MIQLRLLGAIDLRDADGRELRAPLSQPKRLALLAYLAAALPRGFHRRDTLLALLWPDLDTARARNALRQAVHFLRQSLGSHSITSRGSEELGVDTARLLCDAAAFEQLLGTGQLEDALDLYRGDLLPGFFLTGTPAFEDWLERERRRLHDRAIESAWALAAREEARGRATDAMRIARRAVRLAPEDEHGLRRLLELHLRSGDRSGGLRAYEEFTARLRRDLEIAPAAETQDLARALREPVATVAARPAVGPVGGTDSAPAPEVARRARPPARSPRRPLFVSAGVLMLLGTLVTAWLRTSARHAPTPGDAIAVLPFRIRGGADAAYLRDGMVELLSTRLDGAAARRSIDPRAVLAAVERSDTAKPLDPANAGAVALRVGARYYVTGGGVEIAGRLQLNAALYDRARGFDAVSRAAVEGEATQIFALADRLAVALLGASAPGEADSTLALAAQTTASLPAFRAYLDGERAFRAGHYAPAVELFGRAVALDSGFALAYYRLGVSADWAGDGGLAQWAAREASLRSTQLSPVARQLVTGFYAYIRADAEQAEAGLHALVAAHPDNVGATYLLGETRFHYNSARGRPFPESRAEFERVLALEPDNPNALLHLARIAALERRASELDTLAERFLATRPDADRAFEVRALHAFTLGDTAERRRLVAQLPTATDVGLDLALRAVAVYAGDPAAAAEIAALYTQPGRSPASRRQGYDFRARFEAARGRWHAAETWLDSLAVEAPELAAISATTLAVVPHAQLSAARLNALSARIPGLTTAYVPPLRPYVAGLLASARGDVPALVRSAAALNRPWPGDTNWNAGRRQVAHSLRAQAELLREHPRGAFVEIARFPFDPRSVALANEPRFGAFERFLRGEILLALGRGEEALRWYESFPSPGGYDLPFVAPAALRLGALYEKMGRREEAAAAYARVMDLWRDCDPELRPLRDEAAQALIRLRPPR